MDSLMDFEEFLGFRMSPLPETPCHCTEYQMPVAASKPVSKKRIASETHDAVARKRVAREPVASVPEPVAASEPVAKKRIASETPDAVARKRVAREPIASVPEPVASETNEPVASKYFKTPGVTSVIIKPAFLMKSVDSSKPPASEPAMTPAVAPEPTVCPEPAVHPEPAVTMPSDVVKSPDVVKQDPAEPPIIHHFHANGMAVLCLRDNSFTLTNGFVAFSMDDQPDVIEIAKQCVKTMNVGHLFFTDSATKLRWYMNVNDLPMATYTIKNIPLLNVCPYCQDERCHRFMAVQGGITQFLPCPVELIPH